MTITPILLTGIFFAIILYWLPSAVAYLRHHRQLPAILALNTLLGWTFLIWVAALVWALIRTDTTPSSRHRLTLSPNVGQPKKFD